MIYLNKFNFENEIKDKVCIIDFYADWCGPCKMMSPIFDELASEYKNKCEFFKINVDDNSEIAGKYSVLSIPTLIIFKNGEKIASNTGALNKETLKKFIDDNI